MRELVLVRHGQSAWNLENRFTGWTDVDLTPKGEAEAKACAERLGAAELSFEACFTSALTRTRRSAEIMLAVLGVTIPIVSAPELNERDYGELTGLNKDQARERFGEEQVRRWRRSYAERPPGGESLGDVQARLLGYHLRTMLPGVLQGRSTLMVGHGNTLRALTMAFDDLSPVEVEGLEFATGEAVIYRYDEHAIVVERAALAS